MMLMPVIRMLATASRCVKREAPSMAPKNSASDDRLFPAGACFGFVDQPGVEIGIDRHLFAGQSIQGEARGHFRDANRAMVDDDVLDRDQHQEDHRANDVVAADDETSERFDHVARGGSSGVSVQQNQARRRNVQCQPEQREQQQRGGKYAEIDRACGCTPPPS